MATKGFKALEKTLSGKGEHKCSDFDKVNLIKQAALRNYLTSHQARVKPSPHRPPRLVATGRAARVLTPMTIRARC